MTNEKFKVIKGGLNLPPQMDRRIFCSAYATDTRLMGVVALCIRWEIRKNGIPDDFYQFFYLDAEEYGFENYIAVYGNNAEELHKTENAVMGSLGGEKRDLTERECRLLLQDFSSINKKWNLPLPEGFDEYAFLLTPEITPSEKEKEELFRKISTPLVTHYQVIHYFLMRAFSKDMAAAAYLALPTVDLNACAQIEAATLCRNNIDLDYSASDFTAYLAESLIECDRSYMLVVTEMTVDSDMKIASFKHINSFKVSPQEAAMKLSRPEFMTVYSLLFEPSAFEAEAGGLIDGAMMSLYESGKLYMLFHDNNDHVKEPVFFLNDDVNGLFYVSDFGQLIAVSYSLEGIHRMEKEIRRSPISSAVFPIGKYEFKEAVLYDFIQSGFDDFNEFLDFIKDE